MEEMEAAEADNISGYSSEDVNIAAQKLTTKKAAKHEDYLLLLNRLAELIKEKQGKQIHIFHCDTPIESASPTENDFSILIGESTPQCEYNITCVFYNEQKVQIFTNKLNEMHEYFLKKRYNASVEKIIRNELKCDSQCDCKAAASIFYAARFAIGSNNLEIPPRDLVNHLQFLRNKLQSIFYDNELPNINS